MEVDSRHLLWSCKLEQEVIEIVFAILAQVETLVTVTDMLPEGAVVSNEMAGLIHGGDDSQELCASEEGKDDPVNKNVTLWKETIS